jgi:3-oxoadipate enol-lactonase
MPYAHAPDGARIYFEVHGSGEPLLLVAGRGVDHHIWNLIRGDFIKHYRVIVYDNRGTGQSDKPEQPPYSTIGFAQDAVAVLDSAAVPRAHVYGVSMGARIGQWLGINHTDRLGALVLACGSPGGENAIRPTEDMRALLEKSDQPAVLDAFFSRRSALPGFFLSMRPSAKFPMPAHADRLHAQANLEHDAWARLPEITAPTLVLNGIDDPIVPVKNAYLLADRIPGAELYLVPRGRHMFFIEYRSEVDREVSKFLARHPLKG